MRARAMHLQYAVPSRLHVRPTPRAIAWLALLGLSLLAWGLIGWVALRVVA